VRTIHHVDSHDSHEWGRLGQYRREAFGDEVARAFFALSCFLEGGVMVFAGAEDGSEDFYRRLLRLKADLPALRQGDERFDGVEADDRNIFVSIRRSSGQIVVPVVNFSRDARRVCISISGLGVSHAPHRAFDHVEGVAVAAEAAPDGAWTLTLDLQPFQAALVELEGGVDAARHRSA
jgi:glycosidase